MNYLSSDMAILSKANLFSSSKIKTDVKGFFKNPKKSA